MAMLAEWRVKHNAALGFCAKILERKRKVFVKEKDATDCSALIQCFKTNDFFAQELIKT